MTLALDLCLCLAAAGVCLAAAGLVRGAWVLVTKVIGGGWRR